VAKGSGKDKDGESKHNQSKKRKQPCKNWHMRISVRNCKRKESDEHNTKVGEQHKRIESERIKQWKLILHLHKM
jgi:hypothetical protein